MGDKVQMTKLFSKNTMFNMFNITMNKSLFFYLGLGLIFLGLICFPAKILVITQPETPETDLLWMGPMYALIIWLWSLPDITLGILESTTSRKTVLIRLIPLLLLMAQTARNLSAPSK